VRTVDTKGLTADPAELRENKLLAALAAPLLADVAGRMTVREANRFEVIYRPGEPMERITLPLSGLYSLMITDPAGSFTSIATVGREGAIELAPALGSVPAPTEIVCLIGGRIAQMAAGDLRRLMDVSPEFQASIFRYLGARFVDCVQVSACHRLHPLEARIARCLLTTRDRIERDEFPCTHELLAGMLGASRPKVSLALEALQQSGLVVHRRGSIRLMDPARLEAATCGCYRTIRNAFAGS
jgi:CRP-like cAMP-binding protein